MHIELTQEETHFIRKAIKNRFDNEKHIKIKVRYVDLNNTLKIGKVNYKEKELSLLRGIANEYIYYPLQEKISSLNELSNIELFKLSKNQISAFEEVDKQISFYNKFFSKKDKKELTISILEPYLRLKNIFGYKCYYSISDDKIYKVGIPTGGKKYISIELDSNEKITTFDIYDYNFENQQNSFMKTVTTRELLEIVVKQESNNQLTERQLFIKEILKTACV